MIIDTSNISPNQLYHTMTQTIIPRPIAWVLSDNGLQESTNHNYNLAPFSYFTPVSSDPPILMISIGKKPDGSLKDTRLNILERKNFVVHISNSRHAKAVTQSSATLDHGISEIDHLNLQLTRFEGFPLPRLSNCEIAYGCVLQEIKEIGNVPQALIFGLITHIYLADTIVTENEGRLHIPAEKIDPLARIGGNEYWVSGRTITIPRPK